MKYEKSQQAFEKADALAAAHHTISRSMSGNHAFNNEADDHARRYGKASNYLARRASRDYGAGHDMTHHGEGKKHGE